MTLIIAIISHLDFIAVDDKPRAKINLDPGSIRI